MKRISKLNRNARGIKAGTLGVVAVALLFPEIVFAQEYRKVGESRSTPITDGGCDSAKPVVVEGMSMVEIDSDESQIVQMFGSTREVRWYCGKKRRTERNDVAFTHVRVYRNSNKVFFTFYAEH